MGSIQKRLLVAVDGSEQALDAVRYAGNLVSPDRVEVVLLHILSKVPESFWDLKDNPIFKEQVESVSAWQTHQEEVMRTHMEKAHQILLSAGVRGEAITAKLQERKVGIARDIAAESQNGYDAVVLGRRGLGNLADLVLGSIANKLIGKLVNIPVWVIGGSPDHRKVLISLDHSEGALRAADYTAGMLAGSERYVTLVHVIRELSVTRFSGSLWSEPYMEKKWLDRADTELNKVRAEAESFIETVREKLIEAGLHPDRVSTKVITGASTRAGAILEEARRGGYGTIVVGRRGMSRVEEFFMGRVGDKIVQLAKDKAVWVVA